MKVKFKPEVEKVLKARFKKDNPNARNKDWVSITTNDSGQSYCRQFLEPRWIEVSERSHNGVHTILSPEYLTPYIINEAHIMPYNSFEITLEDELFEL